MSNGVRECGMRTAGGEESDSEKSKGMCNATKRSNEPEKVKREKEEWTGKTKWIKLLPLLSLRMSSCNLLHTNLLN